MKKIIVVLTVFAIPCLFLNAYSQDLIQKIGNRCPQHYAPDGNYCKPLPGAKEIIPKIDNRCPRGFMSDGSYCYRISAKPANVLPKSGSKCPRGYVPDGDYCSSLE